MLLMFLIEVYGTKVTCFEEINLEKSHLIGQNALELAVGVVKAGTEGAFGDIDELGNLGVGEALDIAEIHDFLVGRRELGDGARRLASSGKFIALKIHRSVPNLKVT